ncbi:MAG: hypothetical protein KatS3mg102_1281 [Planctomycetota bacterium]|nr:MAG: hypothetical protein KatS3mg102_1281 [Planctomycetota bacterium]
MPPPGPLKLLPQPIARPWGGRALAERYHKPLPRGEAPLGESWEASDLPGAVSRLAEGPLAGTPIDQVLGEPLPVLVKLLDARQWLSLQVHPDERRAREIGGGARAKSEAWYVLWAEPGAEIIHGLLPGVDLTALLQGLERGSLEGLVRRVPVHTGDVVYVPAGTLHAIGPGIVLYEVQQPSDTTYRVYDWGRGRELHLVQAARALVLGAPEHAVLPTGLTPGVNPCIPLVRCPAFQLELLLVDRGERVLFERAYTTVLTAIAGSGWLLADSGRSPVRPGETWVVPAGVDLCLKPGPHGLRVLRAGPGAKR